MQNFVVVIAQEKGQTFRNIETRAILKTDTFILKFPKFEICIAFLLFSYFTRVFIRKMQREVCLM